MNLKNSMYYGAEGRASLFDLEIPEPWNEELILFCHGFMGFKDWGAWPLVQSYFVQQGYGFAKLNLSHNGGTTTDGIDFPDEEAFSNNTHSKEVEDLTRLRKQLLTMVNPKRTHLIGHSRGGGSVVLHTQEMPCDTLVLWASISDIATRFPEEDALKEWKEVGFRTVLNGRTRQYLKQNYSLYEDFVANASSLSIETAIQQASIPLLVIHGDSDASISPVEAERLAIWGKGSLSLIPGADHVFGAKHPWKESTLPPLLEKVCSQTLAFLNS